MEIEVEKTKKTRKLKNIDLAKMEPAEVAQLGEQLGKKLGEIGDAAAEKMNKIAAAYGLKTKVYVQLLDATTGEFLKGL